MRILQAGVGPGHFIDRFDGKGAHYPRERFEGSGALTVLDLEVGGRLGRHPTVLAQLYCVVEGAGWVSGSDGERTNVTAGQAALWNAADHYESGTDAGMAVVVLEASSIEAGSSEM